MSDEKEPTLPGVWMGDEIQRRRLAEQAQRHITEQRRDDLVLLHMGSATIKVRDDADAYLCAALINHRDSIVGALQNIAATPTLMGTVANEVLKVLFKPGGNRGGSHV